MMRAVLLLAVLWPAAVPAQPAPPKIEGLRRRLPALGGLPRDLYAARLSAELSRALAGMKAPARPARFRIQLDAEGHVLGAERVDSSGSPAFDEAALERLASYGPGGPRALPVPSAKRMRERVLSKGVLVSLRPPRRRVKTRATVVIPEAIKAGRRAGKSRRQDAEREGTDRKGKKR